MNVKYSTLLLVRSFIGIALRQACAHVDIISTPKQKPHFSGLNVTMWNIT